MPYPTRTPIWRRYLRLIRTPIARDVDDELRFHFQSRVDELVAAGASTEAARVRAEQEFGDVHQVREDLMSIDHRMAERRRRREVLRDILDDARYALRSLRNSPGMALAILTMLALGVGANAATFTFLDSVFLRGPAGVSGADGIRRLWIQEKFSDGAKFWSGFGYAQYDAVRAALGRDAETAIYTQPYPEKIGLGESDAKAQVSKAAVSFFALTGQRAELGRLYDSTDDRLDAPQAVAVVSHRYWLSALNGDRTMIGKTIVVAGNKYRLIGVMHEPFTGVDLNATDIWLPLAFGALGRGSGGPWWKSPNENAFAVLVRPSAAANERQLEQQLTAVLRRPAYGWLNDSAAVARFGSIVLAAGPGEKTQEVRIAIRLAGVALLVLVIACANVVNLLLARAVRRQREIAVRLALGISRSRLVRLLLTENAVLALSAAAIAIAIAYLVGTLLRRLLLPDVHWATSPIDWRVIAFALGVAIVAGLLAGLVPALQSASSDVTIALKANASHVTPRSRLRAALVMAQAALSVMLLSGAALFVQSLTNVRQLDLGFNAEGLVTAGVSFDDRAHAKDPSIPRRIAELQTRLAALPGVHHSALASLRPMDAISWITFYTATDSMHTGFFPTFSAVSRGYFDASGIRLERGEDFPPQPSEHGVIVNEEMARVAWPGQQAIGQCMRFGKRDAACYRVIGVVANSRESSLIEPPKPHYYLPLNDLPPEAKGWSANYVVLGVDASRAASMLASVRAMVRQEFPGGIPSVVRLSDYLEPQFRPWRLGATLFSAFGVLALVVAIVGIYSTTAYGVQQRTHEFGIRIALGAQLADVMRLVLGEGVRVVAGGVVIGILLTALAGRLIASLLYGVTPDDASTAVLVALTLVGAGILATLAPAWRAARVDPSRTLRAD